MRTIPATAPRRSRNPRFIRVRATTSLRAPKRLAALSVAAALLAVVCGACGPSRPTPPKKSDAYLYEDTRRLVDLVETAATDIEQHGTAAFTDFDRPGSFWRKAPTYLFVYDIDGTCLYHGLNKELVGRNLLSLRDAMGKPVIGMITQIGTRPKRDAAAWVFYMWEEGTDLAPTWKSSYVRKAIAPDGKVYLVGSGSSTIKTEKVFLRNAVNTAALLVERRGAAVAFQELRDPSSRFQFRGSYVFVLDGSGHSLIDPAYPTEAGRDMTNFRDAVGRPIISEVVKALKKSDRTWIQYLWPQPGEIVLSRKMMYVRKVEVGGQTYLVGSDCFFATPVWMRP